MTEGEFIDAIACRFPYGDEGPARTTIAEACALGPTLAAAAQRERWALRMNVLAPHVVVGVNALGLQSVRSLPRLQDTEFSSV